MPRKRFNEAWETRSGKRYLTVASLLASTSALRTNEYVAGGAHWFRVAASNASDHQVATAGGVKLYAVPDSEGAVWDLQFGLADDPGLTVDQSTSFSAFVAYGGELRMTGGNSYYVPTPTNRPLTRATRILGTGRARPIVKGNGQDLFRPEHSIYLERIELTAFDAVINGTNSVSIDDIEIRKCYVHDCNYLYFNAGTIKRFIIKGNRLENFPLGLVTVFDLETDMVSEYQEFSYNRVRNVTRFCYRMRSQAPLLFAHNDIDGMNSDGFSGTEAVARVIQYGSGTKTEIYSNTIKNIIATDNNSNLIYWRGGDLFIKNNTFGFFSPNGQFVHQKNEFTKSLFMTDNVFQKTATLWTKTVISRIWYATVDSGTYIERNVFEEIGGLFIEVLNSLFYNDDKKPSAIVVRENVFKSVDCAVLMKLTHAIRNVKIEDNIVERFRNTTNAVIATGVNGKVFVFVQATATTPAQDMEAIEVNRNQVTFINDEATAVDGSLVKIHTQENAAHTLFLSAEDNLLTDAAYIASRISNSGSMKLLLKDNKQIGGSTVYGTGDGTGSDLAAFVNSGNEAI